MHHRHWLVCPLLNSNTNPPPPPPPPKSWGPKKELYSHNCVD